MVNIFGVHCFTGITVSPTRSGSESEVVKSSWTSRIRYPKAVIGVSVGMVVLLIMAFGFCYWQIKKSRASSSATTASRHVIDSLRAKYEVQNEYVLVPDLKRFV